MFCRQIIQTINPTISNIFLYMPTQQFFKDFCLLIYYKDIFRFKEKPLSHPEGTMQNLLKCAGGYGQLMVKLRFFFFFLFPHLQYFFNYKGFSSFLIHHLFEILLSRKFPVDYSESIMYNTCEQCESTMDRKQ